MVARSRSSDPRFAGIEVNGRGRGVFLPSGRTAEYFAVAIRADDLDHEHRRQVTRGPNPAPFLVEMTFFLQFLQDGF